MKCKDCGYFEATEVNKEGCTGLCHKRNPAWGEFPVNGEEDERFCPHLEENVLIEMGYFSGNRDWFAEQDEKANEYWSEFATAVNSWEWDRYFPDLIYWRIGGEVK